MEEKVVYLIILAGGTGQRMQNLKLPKQFMMLQGETLICRSVETILKGTEVDQVMIAIHPSWHKYMETLIADKNWNGITTIIDGGETRLQSIERTVDAIYHPKTAQDDIVLIHDSVRPFVSDRVINMLLESLYNGARAVSPALQEVDSMFEVLDGKKISAMPKRQYLYRGQTPEAFYLETIYSSIKSLTPRQRKQNTGTAQICMENGVEVEVIEGDRENIKITTPADVKLASAMLQYGIAAERENQDAVFCNKRAEMRGHGNQI